MAIEQVGKRLKDHENLRLIKANIFEFDFNKSFDTILAINSLQFGAKEEIISLIQKMQANTEIQGINMIIVPTYSEIKKNFAFMPENDSFLLKLYKDWTIIYSEIIEMQFCDTSKGRSHILVALNS